MPELPPAIVPAARSALTRVGEMLGKYHEGYVPHVLAGAGYSAVASPMAENVYSNSGHPEGFTPSQRATTYATNMFLGTAGSKAFSDRNLMRNSLLTTEGRIGARTFTTPAAAAAAVTFPLWRQKLPYIGGPAFKSEGHINNLNKAIDLAPIPKNHAEQEIKPIQPVADTASEKVKEYLLDGGKADLDQGLRNVGLGLGGGLVGYTAGNALGDLVGDRVYGKTIFSHDPKVTVEEKKKSMNKARSLNLILSNLGGIVGSAGAIAAFPTLKNWAQKSGITRKLGGLPEINQITEPIQNTADKALHPVLKHVEKKERSKLRDIIGLSGMAAASGGALYAGTNGMIDPEGEKALQTLAAKAKEIATTPDNALALHKYIQVAGPAARASLFGMKSDTVMHILRNLWIPGIQQPAPWDPGSQHHYEAFQHGPVSAWREFVPEQFITHPELNVVPYRSEALRSGTLQAFDKMTYEAAKELNIKTPRQSMTVPEEEAVYNKMQEIWPKKDPTSWTIQHAADRTLGEDQKNDAQKYKGWVIDPIMKARDVTQKYLAPAAIGAGALGLGYVGYRIADAMHRKNKKEAGRMADAAKSLLKSPITHGALYSAAASSVLPQATGAVDSAGNSGLSGLASKLHYLSSRSGSARFRPSDTDFRDLIVDGAPVIGNFAAGAAGSSYLQKGRAYHFLNPLRAVDEAAPYETRAIRRFSPVRLMGGAAAIGSTIGGPRFLSQASTGVGNIERDIDHKDEIIQKTIQQTAKDTLHDSKDQLQSGLAEAVAPAITSAGGAGLGYGAVSAAEGLTHLLRKKKTQTPQEEIRERDLWSLGKILGSVAGGTAGLLAAPAITNRINRFALQSRAK